MRLPLSTRHWCSVANKLDQIKLFARFGLKALVELVFEQIKGYTEPRSKIKKFGKGSYLSKKCSFASPENVAIGERVSVGPESKLWASPNACITIDNDVLIGPNVSIFTSNHGMGDRNETIREQPWVEQYVRIGSGVWLGANVVILPGVTIGEGAVIAAGAVVTHHIPAFAIAAGVPAKVLHYRSFAPKTDASYKHG